MIAYVSTKHRYELEFDLQRVFGISTAEFTKKPIFTKMAIVSGIVYDVETQVGSTVAGFIRPTSHVEQAIITHSEIYINSKTKKEAPYQKLDRGFIADVPSETPVTFPDDHKSILAAMKVNIVPENKDKDKGNNSD